MVCVVAIWPDLVRTVGPVHQFSLQVNLACGAGLACQITLVDDPVLDQAHEQTLPAGSGLWADTVLLTWTTGLEV